MFDPAIMRQRSPRLTNEVSAHDSLCKRIERTAYQELQKDILQRKAVGIKTYGSPLQPNNGRCNLIDAFQESLDKLVYLENEYRKTEDPEIQHLLWDEATSALRIKLLIENRHRSQDTTNISGMDFPPEEISSLKFYL